MPKGVASFAWAGGSKLSTRKVTPQEMRKTREIWAGFDSTYADKYDKQEPACKRAKRPEKDSQTAEPACKRAKRSEKDSQTADDVQCEHANLDRRASPEPKGEGWCGPVTGYWSTPQDKHDVHCGICGIWAKDLNPVSQAQPFFVECLKCGLWCCNECYYVD